MMKDLRVRHTRSADGTDLTYYVLGSGPHTWLMPPAMGAPLVAMRRVVEPLSDLCTIVTWDMRGFHRSGAPADPHAYGVEHNVEDLEAVVQAERLERFVLGGWSMAVPVSLEYLGRGPDADIQALVLINGPFEALLYHALPVPGAAWAVTRALELAAHPLGRLFNPLSVRVLGRPGMGRLLVRIGLLARDPAFFEQILDEFRHVDWSRYLTVMRLLSTYSAARHLDKVRVPTLITAGTRDAMTPLASVERLHRRIPGSELCVVEGGTHYTPAEYPEVLVARIRRFLARHFPAGMAA
ncbi:MAG: alpha/beta hydrolase [Myxococcales bacterium]|nr:alpha/beta hydrolase [Myxococcales bacterium]